MLVGLVVLLARVVKADLDGLAAAADVVRKGGVICYPTDTVYGLGCDPLNQAAIEKALEAKGRGVRPMPVLVHGIADAEKIVTFSQAARKLAKRFWPGALSIILPAEQIVPPILAPDRTLAVRSPKHMICQQLLTMSSGMLVGTSANLSGSPAATSAEQIVKQVIERVDLVIDGGRSPIGMSSTVVDLTKTRLEILRDGPVGKREIMRALRESG
jgi:L-threonylcarbamoyladenylate synthase